MSGSSALSAAQDLHRAGRLAEAQSAYERLLAADPRNAEVHHLLGVLACQRGEPARGAALIAEAIARDERQASYHANLAVALKELGRADEAMAALQRARALAPDDIGIAYNLAALLQALGRHTEAIPHYQRVLAVSPGHVDALTNFGSALNEIGRSDEALGPLHRAVERAPDRAMPFTNLGLALAATGAPSAAAEYLRRACELGRDEPTVHSNLATVLHQLSRNTEAVTAWGRAIALAPRNPDLHYNLANTLRDMGQVTDALHAYGRALACDAQHVSAARDRLSMLLYAPDVRPAERFAIHLHFAAAHAARRSGPAPRPRPDPERPLRIGYLSSDFRHHPVARNVEPLLSHRDRHRFTVSCYADLRRPDPVTDRIRRQVDEWRDITRLPDDEVAALIRKDRIDILVTLAGRFDSNRPLVSLRRPAPIQISFHDPATSGVAEMDYLIADRHLAPQDSRERFTERVLRLPSFYVHAPIDILPPAVGSGQTAARPLTFASFCHPAKLGPSVLALWGGILARLPASRLQLAHRDRFTEPALQSRVRAALGAAGAAGSQIEFLRDQVREAHLARYGEVDIALDPFPFAGSTSTFEALSMGVPVVTLEGDTMVGRWTSAMLRALKLDGLVAATPERYAAIVVGLAQDHGRRAELRRSLRSRVMASPLCDGTRRARQVERLYRAVWRRWCARQGGALASP